ncbi:scaffold attachment factor B1 isoform X2 [Octopus bimaculoides]|nr:scaffold attachment factor B1 isoform X2 [Octopus bimaculoides]
MKLEKMKLEKEKLLRYRMEKELLEMERRDVEMRLNEMRHPAKKPHDRNRLRDELWDEPKRSRMISSGHPSRFELPFQNESRYNEYENTDYGRRDSRSFEGGSRYDERKEREMMRREMGPFRDIRVRDERRAEDRSRTDEKLNRMPFELRRDMGPSGEPDKRYVGSDRGRDNDRRNMSSHDRLGRVRNSVGGGPDQRSPWDSGSVDRKVDNWSHMHGDMDQSNEPWLSNPMHKTGRDASGAFVDNNRPGNSGGMGQNLGPGNTFGNSQSHSGIMMVTRGGGGSGSNTSGRMQEPRFDAYSIMGSM